MLPKEHGAYGQMAFPTLTAIAITGATAPAILTALATLAAFLVHEPVAVLAGRRGRRVQREAGMRALCWLTITGAATVIAGFWAVRLTPPAARWSFLVPALGAGVVALLFGARQEKSAAGEIAVAVTFSSVALPIGLSAGLPWTAAAAVALAYATLFVAATLAVRVVVLGTRAGGDPRAVGATRLVLGLVCVVEAGLVVVLRQWSVPRLALFAPAPGVLTAIAIAARPPAPAALRRLGWTVIVASAATAVALVAAFRNV